MGFFDNIQAKADAQKKQEIDSFLLPNEEVEKVFSMVEDYAFVTNRKRLVFIDKQLISSRKGVYSVPFSKISCVSLSRGGFMKLSSEVELTISGKSLELKFYDGNQAKDFYMTIAERIIV